MLERRRFLALISANLLSAGLALPGHADDDGGGSDGGDSGSDDGGGGHGGSGSDDGGNDDGGDDHGGNSGSGSGKGRGDDDNDESSGSDDDQRRARYAVRNGNAASLREILKTVRRRYKGEVVDVKLNRKGATYTYRIKMLSNEGRLYLLTVDARTKRILKVSGL